VCDVGPTTALSLHLPSSHHDGDRPTGRTSEHPLPPASPPAPLPAGDVAFHAALYGAFAEINRQLSLLQGLLRDAAKNPDVPERPPPDVGLTRRQLEILRFLAEGRSTAWIAAELWLSVATVRNHVAGAMRALDAHSRLEAVARARALGLL
jgi:DNA-binding CsgD family transcriptional regulator